MSKSFETSPPTTNASPKQFRSHSMFITYESITLCFIRQMASIEVSLASSTNTPRRRKGTSLGGASTISARASPRPSMAAADSISLHSSSNLINSNNQKTEHRSALQEREAIIQNLRMQLGLGKLPRPSGTPLDESERPAAEQRLLRLRNDADNKRVAIRNLKTALDKLDISE